MTSNQESRNAEEIVKMRDYFLSRIDAIQAMLTNGVTKDDLSKELDRVYQEIAETRQEMNTQVVAVKADVQEILDNIKDMKKEITDRQKESYRRIIGVQATVLLVVLGTVATLVGQLLLHH